MRKINSVENSILTSSDKNLILGVVLSGFLLNMLYWVVLNEFGVYSKSLFFIFQGDPFADFFKSSLSYVKYDADKFKFLPNIYAYLMDNPYKSYNALTDINILTNFHNPPGTVLIKLFQADLIKKIGPVTALFLVDVFAISALLKALRTAAGYSSFFFLFFLVMFSYPVLFALFRGNTQAIINASALIAFMVLAYEERSFFMRSLLLAVSINLRPVSAVFIFYYFLKGDYKEFIKNASVVFALTILVLFFL
jgi:hypothetical protein